MIHLKCNYFGHLGIELHGYYFCNALNRYHQVALHPGDDIPARPRLKESTRIMLDNASTSSKSACTIGVGQFEGMQELKGDFKIAFIAWETSYIPEEQLRLLNAVDEIWTPSAWGKSIFEQSSQLPARVKVIPEGVDIDIFRPLKQTSCTAGKPFRFLFVGKWEVRKGIDRLLQAWSKAFPKNTNVELILHGHNSSIPNFDLRAALKQVDIPMAPVIASYPRANTHEMVALYNSCDAFVLPTRGEGWGLPIIEAMACEKPVIVTDYSAHTSYANEDNAYLIGVKRMIDVDDPMFYKNELNFGQWADPDVEHLVHLLRHVVINQDEARGKAIQARKDVVAQWTWDHAAKKAWQRIEKVTELP